MSKYKICVYAISKNEEKFVERWYQSMKEADDIYVLDTGSKDKTVKKLKKLGVHTKKQKFSPWRFDVARNASLAMLPEDTDICVCTDLDECFEPGWRKRLEEQWSDEITRARYLYNWHFNDEGKPDVTFYIEKIHKRLGFQWTHPVHEVLHYQKGKENIITLNNITLNHYPDKEKSRSSYLPLLELSVKEAPTDDRNMHYLGREYMYYKQWDKCIDTLIKHLSLKTATWKDERSASMRFISRAYIGLNRYDEALMWLDKAILETPYLRDPLVEKALLEYQLENYEEVITLCEKALTITEHYKNYVNETFSWDHTIFDLLSIAYFHLGNIDKSLENVISAIKLSPSNTRLLENKKIIEQFINDTPQKKDIS